MSTCDSDELLATLLVQHGLLSREQADQSLRDSRNLGLTLGDMLARTGRLTSAQIDATVKRPRDGTAAAPGPGLPPEAEAASRSPANLIGRYVRVARLGAGGMGEVWKSYDTELLRWVALKFLKGDDQEEIARFKKEAQLAGKLSHPGIAAVYEVGQHQSVPFIAMQYVPGRTLREWRSKEARSPKTAARYLRDTARAVAFAHQKGVIHRDLKPENVMVDESDRVFVMDFGVARDVKAGATLTASGVMVGTPAYMSPEQARGERADESSDVYSLGATFYYLLAGQPPFEGGSPYQVILKVVGEDPPAPRRLCPDVPRELECIALRCMGKERSSRYAGAGEVADDLDRWLGGDVPRAALDAAQWTRLLPLARAWAARRIPILVAALLAAAGLAVGAAVLVASLRRSGVGRAGGPHLERAQSMLRDAELAARSPEPPAEQMRRLLDDAARECTTVLESNPASVNALRLRAEARTLMGSLAEADADLTAAMRIDPDPALRLQRAHVRAQIYQEARELPLPIVVAGILERIVMPRETAQTRALRNGVEEDLAPAGGQETPMRLLIEGLLLLTDGHVARAEAKFAEVIQARPFDPTPLLGRALCALAIADFPSAITDLDRALRLRPAYPQALIALAGAEYARTNYAGCGDLLARAEPLGTVRLPLARLAACVAAAQNEALPPESCFRDALNLRPDDGLTRLLVYLAQRSQYSREGSYSWAATLPRADQVAELEAILAPALATEGCPGLVWLYHGMNLLVLEDAEGAGRVLTRAIELDPTLGPAFGWRCVARLRQDDFPGAADDWILCREYAGRERQDPSFSARLLRAAGGDACLARLGKAATFPAALLRCLMVGEDEHPELLEAVIDRAPPGWHKSHLEAHRAYRRRDLTEARRLIDEAMKERPDSCWLWQHKMSWGEREARLGCLQQLVRLEPLDAMSQYNLAMELVRQGRSGEAIPLMLRNTYSYGSGSSAISRLAELSTWVSGGAAAWPAWVRSASKPAPMWAALALRQLEHDRLEEALRAADEAVRLDPASPWTLTARAQVLLRMKRKTDALKDAEAAAGTRLFGPRTAQTLAACRWANGDVKGAAAAYDHLAQTAAKPNRHASLARLIREWRNTGTWRYEQVTDVHAFIEMLALVRDSEPMIRAASGILTTSDTLVPKSTKCTALTWRARAKEMAGRDAEALEDSRRAVEGEGDQPCRVCTAVYARLLLKLDKPAEALAVLGRVISGTSRLRWLRARAFAALHQRDNAIEALTQFDREIIEYPMDWVMDAAPTREEFDRLMESLRASQR